MLRAALETPRPDPREQALARTLGLPDLVARVLLARGIESPSKPNFLGQIWAPCTTCSSSPHAAPWTAFATPYAPATPS